MTELKTQENEGDVQAFLENVHPAGRLKDARVVLEIMERVTACPGKMWGSSIIGFDRYEYTQKNGKPAAWSMTAFAPRKANMVIYIMPGFSEYQELLGRLGPHKHSVSCLYFGRLAKIDLSVLEELIAASVQDMRKKYC